MLDILEKFLIRKGCCFSRLDGSTPTGLRQSLVDDFNSSPSKQVAFDVAGQFVYYEILFSNIIFNCRSFSYQLELVDLDLILLVQIV